MRGRFVPITVHGKFLNAHELYIPLTLHRIAPPLGLINLNITPSHFVENSVFQLTCKLLTLSVSYACYVLRLTLISTRFVAFSTVTEVLKIIASADDKNKVTNPNIP